ncbi:TMV resistance protein N, partial [Mucuna pruriens]
MSKPTSSSSSSFAYEWTYDVFLSFRGEDTRTGFTGNLYHALCEKGVNTFMDDQELRKGEEITPALMKAIQESRISIVIFSQNYASSTFCLQELVNIMECFKHKGRLVWPVFYQVDPSDVRHQKGSYAEALAKHETTIHNKDKVKKWRLILEEAANLSGWHFKQGYEYEFIREIIQEVSERINRIPLHVANYPVGLDSRLQKVEALLDVESNNEVHMVGIYGIGGMGKTTIACAVYNSIADQFEGLSFLADIRENSVKHELVQLQETLLSDIVGEKDIKLGNVKKGIPIIKSRLCKKKILLILDDVDRLEQLKVLAGGLDWFGSGSRIIITTRDIHLLHVYGVERTYEVEALNHKEALELFRWNAFRRKQVNPSYLDISERLILHCNGLPLSLEIIGSDLFGKSVSEWKSALDAYERIPHENIHQILRVSYDGLKEFEKEIFLDMACFFKGYELRDVVHILHGGRGFAPDYVIQVLIDKCLIKIVQCRVRMHNLIENMGREIVRKESPSKPGERSRLWFSKDILRVLKENKGSDKTEIIMLHLSKDKEVQWDGNALNKMENLKILVVKNAFFSRGPNALPKSLRVLKWSGYPESSLPPHFDPKKLAILDLSMSFFSFKNQLIMKFKSLTEMKLSGCKLLQEVPNMSGAPNLKKLYLDNCKNLVEVHDSVGFLDKLEFFNLNYCTSLRVLPRGINLNSLKTMSLRNCTSLVSFPEILGKMKNLRYLDLVDSAISGLPFSIGNLVGLTILNLKGCNGLLELPSSIFMLPNLVNLKAGLCKGLSQIQNNKGQDQESMSSNVKEACFDHCYLTDKFLAALLPFLHNVTSLSLSSTNITILPSSISSCLFLTELILSDCNELREIRGLPPNIKYLSAVNSTSLTFESKQMLLNQTLHETGGRHFKFPGSTVPSWLNHHSRVPSLHFWFRDKFPAIILCAVGVRSWFPGCKFKLIINGVPLFPAITLCQAIRNQTNHIILSDLLPQYVANKFETLHIKNGWNSAEISFFGYEVITYIEWIGVHVQEQKTNMEDIQFTNPDFSVGEKQFPNQFITADRERAPPSSRTGHMKLLQCTVNCPKTAFEARTALLSKKRKRNDDFNWRPCEENIVKIGCKEVQWDGNALKIENHKILIVKNALIIFPKLTANFDPKKLAILDLSFSSFTFDNQLIMVCIIATYHEIYLVLNSVKFQLKIHKINTLIITPISGFFLVASTESLLEDSLWKSARLKMREHEKC